MVGIALLGAGIFATAEHLPAIEACADLELVAIYSRSQASADALAAQAKSAPAVYYDSPSAPGKSLDDLLARSDIAAVTVCLPILKQPDVIRRALLAGKHVLSEKPVAKDVATARELIAWHAALGESRPLWAIGENFRYRESLQFAAEQVKSLGGRLVGFSMNINAFVADSNKYLSTEWRKTPEYQGGFLLDGGVHFVAALRLLLAGAGDELRQLASFASLREERLGPLDTINAAATTRAGATGSLVLSFGTEFGTGGFEVGVSTTEGSVTWGPVGVKVARRSSAAAEGGKAEESRQFAPDAGVKAEVAAFARGVRAAALDPLQTPEEALRDLEVLQALLESGTQGAVVKTLA